MERWLAKYVKKFFGSIPVHRDLEKLPTGAAGLEQILQWDLHCRTAHSKCQQLATILPTRVIDVGLTNMDCRLHESMGARESYVTLSHCWGKLEILKTLRKNIADLKQHIDVDALPKTFQDAIYITRHLQIRYLWIDSLCIIQDDIDDWARESAKMASIYRESYLTVAATSAKDGSEGLFKPRDVDTCYIHVNDRNEPNQSATIAATKAREHSCLLGVHDEVYSNPLPPLMTRAWVYQERLLSRRILHFASDEMVWECAEDQTCECGLLVDNSQLTKQRDESRGRNEHTLPDRTVFDSINLKQDQDVEEKTRHWYQLIQNYTMLSMTKEEDRLPAFSGIASTLMDTDNYLAGIRKDNAERDLLWFSKTTTTPSRPKTYLAPSWSWASFMGAYGNSTKHATWPLHSRFLAQIKEIYTSKATSDTFGRVNGGKLKIFGHYFKAVVQEKDKRDIIGETFGRHWLRMEIPSLPSNLWPYDVTLDTIENAQEARKGASVVILALWARDARIFFLILRKSSSFSSTYQRIGIIDITTTCNIAGKMTNLAVEDILGKAKSKDFIVV